jgi:membrane-associated protease RseP (regulator of RpoE activity)
LFSVRGEGQIDRLQVGDLTARDVPVVVLDHPVLRELGSVLNRRLDGIIGYTFFARYRTTIDYQARTMTFEPVDFRVTNLIRDLPERLAVPKVAHHVVLAPGGLWGLSLDAPAEGLDAPGVPIREVLAGSPAALAGLKPGDVLTAIDGRWTTSIADVYTAAAGAVPDRDASVVVLRDGHEQTVTVRPKPGI